MTELEFTIKVRDSLIHRMGKVFHELYLCKIADMILYQCANAPNIGKCYDGFNDWIKHVGQTLLDDYLSGEYKEFVASRPWSIKESTIKEKNEFRLNKLNERIKELEDYEKQNN